MRPNWENECVNKSALIEWLRPYLHTGEPIPADVLISDIQMMPPTLTPQNEWVSVEDRMPEDDTPAGRKQITVMVATKAGKVTIASRVFEPERDYCGKVYPARWLWSRWLNNHVTHWMELPAPPDRRPPERQEDTE